MGCGLRDVVTEAGCQAPMHHVIIVMGCGLRDVVTEAGCQAPLCHVRAQGCVREVVMEVKILNVCTFCCRSEGSCKNVV